MSTSEIKLKIVIVEDDTPLRDALVRILAHFGHDVRGVGDGTSMDAALADCGADIILLDINLPVEDGIRITRRLRQSSSCGIIMLTGRSRLDERLSGYQCGADHYFVKPVNPDELNAAIISLGRRIRGVCPSVWCFDAGRSRLITPGNIPITLTSHQAIVLELLTSRKGETVSRTELLGALGHPDDEYGHKRLETLLSRLRSRVRTADPLSELPVRARQNTGYAFLDSVQ